MSFTIQVYVLQQLGLCKSRIDLKNGKIYFPRIKGGRDLYLPLHPALQDILDDYIWEINNNGSDYLFQSPILRNQPISAGDIRMNLRKIVRKSEMTKRVTQHILRHCTATHLTLRVWIKNIFRLF